MINRVSIRSFGYNDVDKKEIHTSIARLNIQNTIQMEMEIGSKTQI